MTRRGPARRRVGRRRRARGDPRGVRCPAGARPARRRAVRGRGVGRAPSSRRTAGCWPPWTASRSARCSSTTRDPASCCAASAWCRAAQGHGVAARLVAGGRGARVGPRRRGRPGQGAGGAARVDRVLEAPRLRAVGPGRRHPPAGEDVPPHPHPAQRRRRRRGPSASRWPACCGAGDLVILSGDLGAGKTTLTQGIGAGLGVRGEITSPTFVIARVHPSLVGGPPLVHVDAYRLGGIDELDDLDLDTSLDDAVTVVEWGEGWRRISPTSGSSCGCCARSARPTGGRGRRRPRGRDRAGRAALARRRGSTACVALDSL